MSCRLGVAKARMCTALAVKRTWHIFSQKGYQRWQTSTVHGWENVRPYTGYQHDNNGLQRRGQSTSRGWYRFDMDISLSVKKCDLRPTQTTNNGTLAYCMLRTRPRFEPRGTNQISWNMSVAQPLTPADCRSVPSNAMQGNGIV